MDVPPPPAKGDAQAIIEAMLALSIIQHVDLKPDTPRALIVPKNVEVHSVKRFIDEYRTAPERRAGTARVQDLASFTALANRFKDADSVIFADRNHQEPSLTAVLDYHRAGPAAEDRARFGDHRIVYMFPLSEAWKEWRNHDGEKMGQADFSTFLEDRIIDVLPPPGGGDLGDARFPGIDAFSRHVTASWASPATLVELARGLSIRVGSRVKDVRNLASGEAQMAFESEHHDESGAPLRIPQLFLIGIPVFDAGPSYRIVARLRYRVTSAGIVWFYDLWRPDLALRHAFDEACETVRTETGLPLVYGFPEIARK